MLGIRPYKSSDANTVLSWIGNEKMFYQWSAGKFGNYPITQKEFSFVESMMPFVAFDESGIVGFFTLRTPNATLDELRFGFIIVSPDVRGKGYGKAMLSLGLKFAFEIYGAKRVSLGVFENNPSAYHCYKSLGFEDVTLETPETYTIMGEEWKCKELIMEKP